MIMNMASFGYPEILLAFLCCFLVWCFTDINGMPWNWPLVGMLPSLFRHVNRIHDRGVEFKKIFDVLGDGIFNSDADLWRSQRKQARALITHERFRKFLIKTSWEKVEKGLIPVLEHVSEQGMVIDLQDLFQRLTFDTTCILVTGFDPGCLSTEFPDVPFSKAMDEAEEAILMRHCLPESLWKLGKLLGIGPEKKLSRAWAVLDDVIAKYVSMKREEMSKSNRCNEDDDEGLDLLTSYINGDESTGLECDDKFLRDTILNFMIAGRDTTSSALTWFMWLVSTHPEVERKIRDELNSIIPTKESNKWRMFQVDELRNLVYLHGALCEALRLYPPVPFQHKAPVQDSKEFKPERWITERGTIKYEPSYKFLAFNAGPRTCLGKEVAFTQLKAVAAAIIHNYQVEVVKGHIVTPNVSVILYMKHGLKVRVSKRWT
ncbi:UNVERIFIED_CONTAM: Alkane hydroxylase MAH1 [Sesamum radiatum]|uniref:Alkane hydroxylase MAH1 n=1 Tax=Sesamum radiatum TaxID=300843 RepID=A0AAW2JF82_SESRA